MEQNKVDAFRSYLSKPTDYAILLTGKWGTGKTYFYKNHLEKEIKSVPSSSVSNSNSFKSVYISLFGLKSIQEIEAQIALHFITSKTKIPLSIAKNLFRGIFSISQLGDIDNYIKDWEKSTNETINFNEIVLCFDDLERRDEKLPINEFHGYINNLIETYGSKIILINNETEIKDKDYKLTKEKVVGITIDYNPSTRQQVMKIINSNLWKESSKFKELITNNLDEISVQLEHANQNLRTIIFILEQIKDIYYLIQLELTKKQLEKIKERTYDLLKFAISISIEYKEGMLNFNNRHEIEYTSKTSYEKVLIDGFLEDREKSESEDKDKYRTKFIEKYFKREAHYYFIESIYNYITHKNRKFNCHKFYNEFESLFARPTRKLEYILLDNLNSDEAWRLTDKQYRTHIEAMLKYAFDGSYKISELLSVYNLSFRFNNVLNLKPKELRKQIIWHLKRNINSYKAEETLEHILEIYDTKDDISNEARELIKELLAINEKIIEQNRTEKFSEIIKKLFYSTSDFIDEYRNTTKNDWASQPIFAYQSPYKFNISLNKLHILCLVKIYTFLRDRYINERLPLNTGSFIEELPFWKELSVRLKPSSISRKRKNRKNYILDLIWEQTKLIVEKMEKIYGSK